MPLWVQGSIHVLQHETCAVVGLHFSTVLAVWHIVWGVFLLSLSGQPVLPKLLSELKEWGVARLLLVVQGSVQEPG